MFLATDYCCSNVFNEISVISECIIIEHFNLLHLVVRFGYFKFRWKRAKRPVNKQFCARGIFRKIRNNTNVFIRTSFNNSTANHNEKSGKNFQKLQKILNLKFS